MGMQRNANSAIIKRMLSKKYQIIVALAVMMIVPLSVSAQTQQSSNSSLSSIAEECSLPNTSHDSINTTEARECITQKAAEKLRPDYCAVFMDSQTKINCYLGVARAKKDPNVCAEISREYERGECFSRIAPEFDDVEVCLRSENGGYALPTCLTELAKKRKDPSLCNRIPTDFVSETYLNEQYARMRAECFASVAQVGGVASGSVIDLDSQIDTCMRIENNGAKVECVSNIAHQRSDASVCQKLDNDVHKARCITAFITEVPASAASTCETIQNDVLEGYCLLQGAFAGKNATLCEKISSGGIHSYCNAAMASRTADDRAVCTHTNYFSCLLKLSRRTGESQVCDLAENDDDNFAYTFRRGLPATEYCKLHVPFSSQWISMWWKMLITLLPWGLLLTFFMKRYAWKASLIGMALGALLGFAPPFEGYFGMLLPWFWPIYPILIATQKFVSLVSSFQLDLLRDVAYPTMTTYMVIANAILYGFVFGLIARKKWYFILLGLGLPFVGVIFIVSLLSR